jgi:hypothetical protein
MAANGHVTSKDLLHASHVVRAACHVLWGTGWGLQSCRDLDLDLDVLKITCS